MSLDKGSPDRGSPGRPLAAIRLAAALVVIAVTVATAEGLARVALALDAVPLPALAGLLNKGLALNAYQRPSDRFVGHWLLRSGWGADAQAVRDAKRQAGRAEGADALAAAAAAGYGRPLTINGDGFKGSPIDGAHARPRVLAIGDSVTFGLGGFDWPSAMAARLAALGVGAEVVNGGVEGYWTRNALMEVDRYLALRPQICVVLLGWNDLFAEDGSWGTPLARLQSVAMVRRSLRLARTRLAPHGATALRAKPMQPDANTAEVARYRDYQSPAVERLEHLGDALAQGGCSVVLGTLPGLFASAEVPTAEALARGHLPEFTDNPFVLAAMAEGLARDVRGLAARKGWRVLDLEAWGWTELRPRADWFSDSVHLTAAGLDRLGQYAADQLAPVIARATPRP